MSLVVNLEYKPYVALYRRLSDSLRKAILEGRLRPGGAMPSVRELADSMMISRATVLKAYEDLREQGFVTSVGGMGTFVAQELPGDLAQTVVARLSESGDIEPLSDKRVGSSFRVLDAVNDSSAIDCRPELPPPSFSPEGILLNNFGEIQMATHLHLPELNFGGTGVDLAPIKEWRSLLFKHSQLTDLESVSHSYKPFGYEPLREAIAGYLGRSRSIKTNIDNLCLFGSKQLRLELILRLMVEAGDYVAVEEPGFSEARLLLEAHGANIVPVSVDSNGIVVDELKQRTEPIKLVYVTPSHHDPLAAVMSMPRRLELIKWAKQTGAFIIEDDFDNEFRYGTAPLPALKALDDGDCVIYVSSFWKLLHHSVRLSYVVIPDCLREPFERAKVHMERHLPLLEQFALTEFINSGYLERHIKRCQRILAGSRQTLILAMTRHLKGMARISKDSGGTHIIAYFDKSLEPDDVIACAREAGLLMISTAAYYMGEAPTNEYMITFAGPAVVGLEDKVRNFAELLSQRTPAALCAVQGRIG